MKRILLIILLIIPFVGFSQINLFHTTRHLEVCDFNKNTNDFENCKIVEDKTLIDITEDPLMLVKTNKRGKDFYNIISLYEKERDVYEVKVKDKNGLKMTWWFHYPNKEIITVRPLYENLMIREKFFIQYTY